MSLSCYCEWDGEGWYFFTPNDFTRLDTKRARKCCSCGKRINVGDECAKFVRERPAINDIEQRICGDEIPLAPYFMCEECAGIFFALDELGYCVTLGTDSMRELAAQYADMQKERRSE